MEENYSYVPNEIFDALVKRELLQPVGGSDPGYYLVNCSRSNLHPTMLTLTMQFDDQKIVFGTRDLLWNGWEYNPCAIVLLPFRKLATPDNSRAPSFVFGYGIWRNLCIAFNYTDNTLGLGFPSNRNFGVVSL
jgi:hypothetical protein